MHEAFGDNVPTCVTGSLNKSHKPVGTRGLNEKDRAFCMPTYRVDHAHNRPPLSDSSGTDNGLMFLDNRSGRIGGTWENEIKAAVLTANLTAKELPANHTFITRLRLLITCKD